MAERRMFAKTIIDSDTFLDMPLSTQSLYFHLSMRADDEGFINNPKKIQRMIGATEDDLKLLNAKNFIIPFESGVVVIKHWKIHNYIRADRLVETQYKEEKALLTVKENGAYTIDEDIKELQSLDANDKRKLAYQKSSLPYSFTYKIRRAFEGCACPLCGQRMTSSFRNAMPTIQHNLPISKGGEHEIDNISVICESCKTSIKDNATEDFNTAEVIEKWDKITLLEKQGIKWFDNPQILCQSLDSHMSVTCQSNVSIGKDRIGKDSLGKVRLGKNNTNSSHPNEEIAYADVSPIPLSDGSEWQMPLELYKEYEKSYPALDIKQEVAQMRIWSISNPSKKKTRKGITRFVNNWLDASQNSGSKRKGSNNSYGSENIIV